MSRARKSDGQVDLALGALAHRIAEFDKLTVDGALSENHLRQCSKKTLLRVQDAYQQQFGAEHPGVTKFISIRSLQSAPEREAMYATLDIRGMLGLNGAAKKAVIAPAAVSELAEATTVPAAPAEADAETEAASDDQPEQTDVAGSDDKLFDNKPVQKPGHAR